MFLPPGVNDVRGQNCPIKGTHLIPDSFRLHQTSVVDLR